MTQRKPPIHNARWRAEQRRLDFNRGYVAGMNGRRSDKTKSGAWFEGYQLGKARFNALRALQEPQIGILDAAEARYTR